MEFRTSNGIRSGQADRVPGKSKPTEHHQRQSTVKSRLKPSRSWLWILVALLVIGVGFLAYGYIHTKNQLNAAKNPAVAGKTEISQIENQIQAQIALPNETPTLATVSDVNKLSSQIFFKNAQNGDKVLIFPKAGTALLYRPSSKKVIEYAPVNLGSSQ